MVKTTMARYKGRSEKPEFTYEPVDVSLIPPRKRLMEIRRNPVNSKGEKTTPVMGYECLEEECGACSMVINGRARQSCSAADQLSPHS